MKQEPRNLWQRRADNVASCRLSIAMEQIQKVMDTPNALKSPHAENVMKALLQWHGKCLISSGEHGHIQAEIEACGASNPPRSPT